MIPGISHFLMGGRDKNGYHLYDIFPDGTITLIDDFVSSGSGSVMVYGVLETLYHENITTDEGVKLVLKSINASMQRDTYSGNGVDVVVINNEGAKKVFEKQLDTTLKF